MDTLRQEIADLELQEINFQNDLNNAKDDVQAQAFVNELNIVRNKLSEKRHELQQYHAYQEQKETEVVEDITSGIETFTVGDITFTLDQLVVDEDAADILRSGLRTISKTQAQKFLEEINAQKSVYEMNLALKQEQVTNLIADRDELQKTNAQLQLERDDLSEKRDAAATQLLEAQAEIARLNSHVDDLRKEIANGSTPNNIIDITSEADLEAAAQRFKAKKERDAAEKKAADEAARVRIYGVTQLDGTGAKFGAYRADDDTYLTFGWLEKNKYVELSGEEVERFRQELEATKQAEVELVPEADKPVELVDDFRNDLPAPDLSDAHDGDNLVGNEPVSEGAQNHDGGEVREIVEAWDNERLTMFLKRHEKRLNSLENEVYRDGKTWTELAS